ncbi:MAG TPA: quinone-dependent dihydroorotate dehydrogenase [Saprospiraceae bacterium]|nr:quinone-dependent dihydroorotate dehydrogenase [Saprospiraceae bacterium]
MYRFLIRPLLFLLPSERAHAIAMNLLLFGLRIPFVKRIVVIVFGVTAPNLPRMIWGLRFPNPLGIAAGFDKNGTYIDALVALGFGSIEVGSITPRSQPGNPKPRLFRLKKSHALINRMGFNNDGCELIARRLQKYHHRNFVLGANIGKNKDTPNGLAVDDYLACFDALHPYVDYFVINVSSPNTPGLRALQEREPLKIILQSILSRNSMLPQRKPIILKIAPDLTNAQLDDIASLVQEIKLDGLVVSNTTLSREGLQEGSDFVSSLGDGGLSGAPLRRRATEVLKYLRAQLPEHISLIGVGGIDSAESAIERMNAGAALIQIYTGLIYEGPGLVKKILKRIGSNT